MQARRCSRVLGKDWLEYYYLCDTKLKMFLRSKMLHCGMREEDARTLRRQSAVLCKQLVVDELLIQCLQADEILTESMAESIMVCECWLWTWGQELRQWRSMVDEPIKCDTFEVCQQSCICTLADFPLTSPKLPEQLRLHYPLLREQSWGV